VSVLHACLAQAFFCLVVMIAVITSRHWRATPALAELWEKKDFRVSVLMFGAIYLQLILGSILRHSGMMGGSKGAELVPGALIAHILGAVLVVCVSLVGVLRVAQSARSRAGVRLANSLFVLLAMQLMLGVGAYLVRLSIPNRVAPEPLHVMVTTSHVAMGALMLATALILSLQLAQSRPEEGIDGVAGAPLAGGRL
jgi:cytochrome c oxidase assembly protein subunit 15